MRWGLRMKISCYSLSKPTAWRKTTAVSPRKSGQAHYQKTLPHSHAAHQEVAAAKIVDMRAFVSRYKKILIITTSVCVLDIAFGFDIKFTIINMVWLLI